MGDWRFEDVSRVTKDDAAASAFFTTITASGSANTKGAWTTLVASLPFDMNGLMMKMFYGSGANILVDIGIGGAGSEVVVVPNIMGIATNGIGPGGFFDMDRMYLPLSLPAGTRIAARMQSDPGSLTVKMRTHPVAASVARGDGYSRAIAVGDVPASSIGTSLTAGASGVKGSYVQLVASLSITSKWAVILFTNNSGTTADFGVDVAIGAGGSEMVIVPDLWMGTPGAGGPDVLGYTAAWCLPLVIPAGTRIAMRAANSSAGGVACFGEMIVFG